MKCPGRSEKEINNFQQVIVQTSSALMPQMGKITVSPFLIILHKLSQNHKKNDIKQLFILHKVKIHVNIFCHAYVRGSLFSLKKFLKYIAKLAPHTFYSHSTSVATINLKFVSSIFMLFLYFYNKCMYLLTI